MRLDGKPVVRRLHPIGFRHAQGFLGHPFLFVESEEVFNHGIAESYIELIVGDLRKIRRVADARFEVILHRLQPAKVYRRDMDILAADLSLDHPEFPRAANIENAQRAREAGDQRFEYLEPSRTQPTRHG
jgi:hypothetical protein